MNGCWVGDVYIIHGVGDDVVGSRRGPLFESHHKYLCWHCTCCVYLHAKMLDGVARKVS